MELATRVQILNEAVCVSLHANALGKGMNLSVLLSGAITLEQSGPGSHGNDGVLSFPKAPALLKPHYQI